jgi:hypothetical protein
VLSTISGMPASCAISASAPIVGDVAERIADRFAEDRLGARVDQRAKLSGLR